MAASFAGQTNGVSQSGAPSATIIAAGHFLPDRAVSSLEIENQLCADGFHVPAGLIQKISGVAYRKYAGPDCASSDLAAWAALDALKKAGSDPLDVDLLIFASASHDISEPATVNIVQQKTGCTRAHVFDVKNACNSFLNALEIAASLIQTRRAEKVLITSGEMLSPMINFEIQDVADLSRKFAGLTLGDGGGACLLQASNTAERGVFPGRFYSEGSQWQLSTVLSGGTLLKKDFSKWYFECESEPLTRLGLEHMPRLIKASLADMGWSMSEVDYVIPHQVSRVLIERVCEQVSYPLEKCALTIESFGNQAAASIPIALSLALETGKLAQGDKILLVSGAAGFSAGVIPVVL